MILRIKNTELTLQILGWIQTIGGLAGLFIVARLMLNTNDINGALLFIFLTGVLLFLYSIYCGKNLLLESEKKVSIIYSIINYIFQVFQWYFLGYGFTYSSGIELNVGAQKSEFIFNAGLTSDFAMSIQTQDAYFLKINVFALFALITLFDILDERRKIKKQVSEFNAISTSPVPL